MTLPRRIFKKPVTKFFKSFVYAWNGMIDVLLRERNFKIQLAIAVLVLGMAFFLRVPWLHMAIIVLSCVIVLSLEMANTAIEDLVNVMTKKEHPALGKVKDIMAGAVLLASIGTAVAGILILGKPLLDAFMKAALL